MVDPHSMHFVSRDARRYDKEESPHDSSLKRSNPEQKLPEQNFPEQNLDEAYFAFPREILTNQRFICYNCHYEDFVSDEAVYYYLVFGDFCADEPPGFECPNCGGPMVGEVA